MTLFVDTSVWFLALRRDAPSAAPEAEALTRAIEAGNVIITTGLVLQELLQGFSRSKARERIIDRSSAIPLLAPDRENHIHAAELQNRCRRSGVQIGTIDVLLPQLCIRHNLTMLTSDADFRRIAAHSELKI